MSDIAAAGDAPRPSPIRAVVDTSALVPARLRRELQQAAQIGAFVGIWSPWIIAELNRVLVWRWIKDAPPDLTVVRLPGASHHPTLGNEMTIEAISPLYTETLVSWLMERLARRG